MVRFNEEQLKKYGKQLGQELEEGTVLALTGELGAGKTTLAKAIAAGLGVKENVTSPTFTLINEYKSGRLPFYHFDVYRLDDDKAEKALADIGYEEYFFGSGVTVVEWADRVRGLLPENAVWIELCHTENPEIRELTESITVDVSVFASKAPVIARSETTKQSNEPFVVASADPVISNRELLNEERGGKQSGNIFAIETTGPICSVALRTSDGRIFYKASEEGLMHLTSLMPMVRDVLDDAGIPSRKLDLIAASAGPGSFTGIRIGIATVRALAQTLSIQVIKVPTLETFVYLNDASYVESVSSVIRNHIIACPIFDARRDQMYAGAFVLETTGKIMPLVASDAYDPEEFFSALSASAQAYKKLTERSDDSGTTGYETRVVIKLMGDGLPAFTPHIESFQAEMAGLGFDILTEGFNLIDKDDHLLRRDIHLTNRESNFTGSKVQDALAVLAWAEANGEPALYGELEPIYIRKAEAQRRLEEKQAASTNTFIASAAKQSIGNLRRAGEDDVYGISVVERLSFGEPWLEKSILDDIRLEYSDYIVCEKNGVILGYAGLHRILEEGHITNIAVHPSVRNRGIGKAILGELMNVAGKKGIKEFTLEVRAGDEAVICFYEKLGFVTEGIRKDYYPKENVETNESGSLKMGGGREDACLMWLRREDKETSSC